MAFRIAKRKGVVIVTPFNQYSLIFIYFLNSKLVGVTIVEAHLDWTLSDKSSIGRDNLN